MSQKRKVLQGAGSNVVRLLLSMLVSLVVPPFLVHHMPPAEYSAWVLILQLSTYVGLLDFGLQTAIGKFIAQYTASNDHDRSHHLVSTSFTMLAAGAAIACVAMVAMTYSVPRLFGQMPPALVPQVRLALLVQGISTAIAMPFFAFQAIFIGLQLYLFPTLLMMVTRVGSAAGLILLLRLHGSLVQMAMVMAAFNLITAVIQFLGWRRLVRHRVGFSFLFFHRPTAIQLAKYGSVLSVWTLAMLIVSGLDVVIVGHYQYAETGFYAVASSAANFMLLVVSNILAPLLPAISSMQSRTTPARLGALCVRMTRYCVLLMCLLGLPLLLGAYPLLSLWLGQRYAIQSALYLEILVLGYIVRQCALPYSLMVVATGKQHLATIAALSEAAVNLAVSMVLVQTIGAVGVAIGTLVGAFVNLGVHFTVSVPRTRSVILMHRPALVIEGILRALLIAAPSCLLYPFWRPFTLLPARPVVLAIWLTATAGMGWWLALTTEDRQEIARYAKLGGTEYKRLLT